MEELWKPERSWKRRFQSVKVTVNPLEDKKKLRKAVLEADILVNATIVGMKPDMSVRGSF